MISQATLDAVTVGEMTDAQLVEAIAHYRVLVRDLECHGEVYRLVWLDAYRRLMELEGYMKSRAVFTAVGVVPQPGTNHS